MKREAIVGEKLEAVVAELDGWSVVEGKLRKQYKFRDFAAAVGWMMEAAVVIDKMDHHPEWSNVYNRVTVELVTHDIGNQISSLDVELARKLDGLRA